MKRVWEADRDDDRVRDCDGVCERVPDEDPLRVWS